jgi:hypothetical protein
VAAFLLPVRGKELTMKHAFRLGLFTLSMLGCNWPWPIDVPVDELPVDEPPGCDDGSCEPPSPECLFGETFYELRQGEAEQLTLSPEEWIRADAELTDAVEREQLVLAVRQSSYDHVTTVAEALEAVDEDEVRRIWLTPEAGEPTYVVYEYGAGDNSYGAFFAAGELTVLANIHDGDIMNCLVRD